MIQKDKIDTSQQQKIRFEEEKGIRIIKYARVVIT